MVCLAVLLLVGDEKTAGEGKAAAELLGNLDRATQVASDRQGKVKTAEAATEAKEETEDGGSKATSRTGQHWEASRLQASTCLPSCCVFTCALPFPQNHPEKLESDGRVPTACPKHEGEWFRLSLRCF